MMIRMVFYLIKRIIVHLILVIVSVIPKAPMSLLIRSFLRRTLPTYQTALTDPSMRKHIVIMPMRSIILIIIQLTPFSDSIQSILPLQKIQVFRSFIAIPTIPGQTLIRGDLTYPLTASLQKNIMLVFGFVGGVTANRTRIILVLYPLMTPAYKIIRFIVKFVIKRFCSAIVHTIEAIIATKTHIVVIIS